MLAKWFPHGLTLGYQLLLSCPKLSDKSLRALARERMINLLKYVLPTKISKSDKHIALNKMHIGWNISINKHIGTPMSHPSVCGVLVVATLLWMSLLKEPKFEPYTVM